MTHLQEHIYDIIPPNFLEKDGMQKLLDIFFKVLEDSCSINENYVDYFSIETDVLAEDIMQIFLQNIYDTLDSLKNEDMDSRITSQDMSGVINMKNTLDDEHIWSSKDFKQNKGHAVSFYYVYNIIKNTHIDVGQIGYGVDYIQLEENKDDNDELIPFSYTVYSLMQEYLYEYIIKPITHPVGFDSKYIKKLAFSLEDYFCKNKNIDYDVFFIYCINTDRYFDVRDGDGLFGSSGVGQTFRYNTEVIDYFSQQEYNKTYVSITLDNGYRYVKDFSSGIKLYNSSGIVIKEFDTSCGFINVKAEILNETTAEKLSVIDNTRLNSNTVDDTTGIPSNKIYRIDFNSDFLGNSDTEIYLVQEDGSNLTTTLQYHIINNEINLYNSDSSLKYNFSNDFKMIYDGITEHFNILCHEEMRGNIYQDLIDVNNIRHHLIVQEDVSLSAYTEPKAIDLDSTLLQAEHRQRQTELISFPGNTGISPIGTVYSISIDGTEFSYTSNQDEYFKKVIRGLKQAYITSGLEYDFIDNENTAEILIKGELGAANAFTISIGASNVSLLTTITNISQASDAFNLNDYINDYIATNGSDEGLADSIVANNIITDTSLYGLDYNENNVNDFIEYPTIIQDWGWTIGADVYDNLPSNYNVTNINDFNANYTGTELDYIDALKQFITTSSRELIRVSPLIGNPVTEGDYIILYENLSFL